MHSVLKSTFKFRILTPNVYISTYLYNELILCVIFNVTGAGKLKLPKGTRYLNEDEERMLAVGMGLDKSFQCEWDSEKNFFVKSDKKLGQKTAPSNASTASTAATRPSTSALNNIRRMMRERLRQAGASIQNSKMFCQKGKNG